MKIDVGENRLAGLEADLGAGLIGVADHPQRCLRRAQAVILLVYLAIAADGQTQRFRQSVDHRHTDAVQATGNLVGTVVEFATGMQHGHDHFGGGAALGVFIGGNTAAIVNHRDSLIGVDGDADLGAIAGQGLIDRVIHHLEHQVMQAGAIVGIADVHAGTLAYGVQPFQDRNARRCVGRIAHETAASRNPQKTRDYTISRAVPSAS